jgi:anti-sigma factor RsiW
MTCDRAERWILLDQSGELPARRGRKLAAHLAGCARCRAFREALGTLSAAGALALRDAAPGAAALARIREAAAAAQAESGFGRWRLPAYSVLACAAALALLLGGWLRFGPTRESDRIGEIHAIVALVSAQELPEAEASAADDPEARLRALANALLAVEGLAVETGDDLEWPDAIPAAGPEPTALQPRSSDGRPGRRCV